MAKTKNLFLLQAIISASLKKNSENIRIQRITIYKTKYQK